MATDGWSGSTFSEVFRGDQRLILKRSSPATDWIVRATHDNGIREATIPSIVEIGWLGRLISGRFAYLDAARGEDGSAVILLPDLGAGLVGWPCSRGQTLTEAALDELLGWIALLHMSHWSVAVEEGWSRQQIAAGWCPLAERLTLLTRRSATGYAADENPVAPIFLRGWEAFERHAPREALDLVEDLARDPEPLIAALALLPAAACTGT